MNRALLTCAGVPATVCIDYDKGVFRVKKQALILKDLQDDIAYKESASMSTAFLTSQSSIGRKRGAGFAILPHLLRSESIGDLQPSLASLL